MPSLKRVDLIGPVNPGGPQTARPRLPGRAALGGDDRRRRLKQYSPRSIPQHVADKILPSVIDLVMTTPVESPGKDGDRMNAATTAASNYFLQHGLPIVWTEALSHVAYERFKTSRPDLPDSTHGTYKSRWAELLLDSGLVSGDGRGTNSRKPVSRGYSHKEAQAFFAGAQSLTGRREQNYTVACVVTFWAGADPTEMFNLTWDMVRPFHGTLIVRLCNALGEVRDVPLSHTAAAHLRRFMGQPGESVFDDGNGHPTSTSKRFESLFRSHPNLKVDWARARNTFIIRLFEAKVPFHTVAHMADLNPGGHTAQDLLSYCRHLPEEKHIANIMEALR